MLQALYSRSNESYQTHLDKVAQSGSGKFMESFYINYGHASIGDCGSTTVFIEGVSNFVAKAIQDNALYSGQESSTRYLDYSKQACYDPYNTEWSKNVIEFWMNFYLMWQPVVERGLNYLYPMQADEKEETYRKAIRARSFDIMRGYLPSGVTTQLSWHTNLRQARSRLIQISTHPLSEVRSIARQIHSELLANYPNSFKADDMGGGAVITERESWRNNYNLPLHFTEHVMSNSDGFGYHFWGSNEMEQAHNNMLVTRPEKQELPRIFEQYGSFNMFYELDFGSWRDIQRHRNGLSPMPLIMDYGRGIHSWYIESASEAVMSLEVALTAKGEAKEGESLLYDFTNDLQNGMNLLRETRREEGANKLDHQYLHPLGMSLNCQSSYTLPEMVYVSELRSTQYVHPTLRVVAQKMAKAAQEQFPGMAQYVDFDDDKWNLKRGEQDIVRK